MKYFFEKELPNASQDYKIGWKVKKRVYSGKTKYQKVEVLDTSALGRILVLDGIVQLSENYEFIYHEMMTHMPLLYHRSPRRILLVGGGDGGAVRQLLKHSALKEIVWVELDPGVVEISKKYLPFLKVEKSLKQKKVKLFIEDGAVFVKKFKDYFDVIIIDSTDPLDIAFPLFEKKFYRDCSAALKKDGIFITQSGNFLDQHAEIKDSVKKLKSFFRHVKIHRALIPEYQSADFSFVVASEGTDFGNFDIKSAAKRFKKIKGLNYYSPEIHLASGVLPKVYLDKIT